MIHAPKNPWLPSVKETDCSRRPRKTTAILKHTSLPVHLWLLRTDVIRSLITTDSRELDSITCKSCLMLQTYSLSCEYIIGLLVVSIHPVSMPLHYHSTSILFFSSWTVEENQSTRMKLTHILVENCKLDTESFCQYCERTTVLLWGAKEQAFVISLHLDIMILKLLTLIQQDGSTSDRHYSHTVLIIFSLLLWVSSAIALLMLLMALIHFENSELYIFSILFIPLPSRTHCGFMNIASCLMHNKLILRDDQYIFTESSFSAIVYLCFRSDWNRSNFLKIESKFNTNDWLCTAMFSFFYFEVCLVTICTFSREADMKLTLDKSCSHAEKHTGVCI